MKSESRTWLSTKTIIEPANEIDTNVHRCVKSHEEELFQAWASTRETLPI
jgi:hypothetical protein